MSSLMALVWLAGSGVVHAGVEAGIGADLSIDLADSALPEERAGFGPGLSARAPVRFGLAEGVALRVCPRLVRASGWDTVLWQDPNQDAEISSTGQDATLTGLELSLGPELRIGAARDAAVQPYLGASVGLMWVGIQHSFDGVGAEALTGDSGTQLLRASQLVPGSGAYAGLRWAPSSSFAIELEAGYNVSFLSEVAVEGVTEVQEATVAAFGLNALRVGLGATFSFGDGTVR